MAVVQFRDGPLENELLPFAITDPTELTIYDILDKRTGGMWLPKSVTMEGLPGSSRAYAWKDYLRLLKASPSLAGVAPALVNEAGVRNYLRMGYGDGLTYASSGALETPDGIDVWSGPSVTMVAVFRVPSSGGAAGASPGGVLIGNKQPQTEAFSPASNQRWTGIRVGYGTNSTEEVSFSVMGDTVYVNPAGVRDDEDGLWKIVVGIFDFAAQTMELRVNGVSLSKETTRYSTAPVLDAALSATAGAREIRLGASGARGGALTNTFRGDFGAAAVFGWALQPVELNPVESFFLNRYPTT